MRPLRGPPDLQVTNQRPVRAGEVDQGLDIGFIATEQESRRVRK